VKVHPSQTALQSAKIWTVGGGKGGIGKSLVSTLLSIELAHQDKKTVLVDTDFGGANLHALMGIKTPSRTLNDFVSRKYDTLEKICIQTSVKNLQLICGASEILDFANPQYVRKKEIVQHLMRLPVDHVILDLGAGSFCNVLDLFLIADYANVVVTPHPIAIQNAYGFVRNAVYRKLSRMTARHAWLHELIANAVSPGNNGPSYTMHDLLTLISRRYPAGVAEQLKSAVDNIKPLIIANNIHNERDQNAGRVIQLVAEKYLAVDAQVLGSIQYDPEIESLISTGASIAEMSPTSAARTDAAALVRCLLNEPANGSYLSKY
jgi:flagellar biosynthesis protein FlhG